ncbi:MAG: methyltransferase domain-containing protein [bacterium]
MHPNSVLYFEKYAQPLFTRGMKVLEIGPDEFPSTYERMLAPVGPEWHTLDMHHAPELTFPNSGEYSFPVPDGTYDIVLSGQVIEHVRKPWRWIPELARVTRPGGLVITINPVSWIYHEAPIDCWRIYPEGMRALYEEAALEVELCEWGSLESPQFRRHMPGNSLNDRGKVRQVVYGLLGRFGFPVEASFDTITIGRKASING